MSSRLLDTNIASQVIKGNRPEVTGHLVALPMADITISVVTEAELLNGVARRGYPPKLSARVRAFLARVEVLPWDRHVAGIYADLRADWAAAGVVLGSLDMMIAAHAVATGAVLVSRDKAFIDAPPPLKVEDWMAPPT